MNQKLILLQPAGIFVMDLDASKAEARYMGDVTEGRVPAKLLGWLSANSKSYYLLFIDLPSEEIQIDTIPELGYRDRRQYLRLLNQKHRQVHCLSKVDVVTSGNGKNAQQVGIADDACAILLRTLAAHGCLIQSIHSPLTLVGTLVRKLKKSAQNSIYILPIDDKSYRLVACVDKQLVLNRGITIKEKHSLLEIIDVSLRESIAYLRRQSGPDWMQATVFTFSKDLTDHLRVALGEDNVLPIESAAIDKDAQIPCAQSSHSLLMKLAHLAVKMPSLGYRLDIKQNAFLKRRFRHAAAGVAASLMMGATAIAAVNEKLVSEYESISKEHYETEDFLDTATVFLNDENDLPVEAVRQALATAKLVDIRSRVSPLPFLYSLSEHKSAYRAIQIHTVDWHRQDVLDIQSLQGLDRKDADDIRLEAIYHATVVGSVHGDLDDAMVSFDSFLTSLRNANTNTNIRVIEAPFGLSEKSRTTDRDISGGGFSVEVVKSAGDQNGR